MATTIQDEIVNRLKRHITNVVMIGSAIIMVFIIFWSLGIASIIEDRLVSIESRIIETCNERSK